MRLSIVIPIYNAERYLENCLLSILEQGYEECEILLVNDGSLDGSGALCEAYANRYANVRYQAQPNGGVSAARNTGIRMARGEYLLFLDADDALQPGSLSRLDDVLASKAPDAVIAPLMIRVEKRMFPEDSPMESAYFDPDGNFVLRIFSQKRFATPASKVAIKRQLIIENDIRFPMAYHIGEDIFMMAGALCKCKALAYLPEPYYIYNQNIESITHTVSYQRISKTMEICDSLYVQAQELTEVRKEFLYTQASMMLINFLRYYRTFTREEKGQIRTWLRGNAEKLQALAQGYTPTRLAAKVLGPGNAFLLAGVAASWRGNGNA